MVEEENNLCIEAETKGMDMDMNKDKGRPVTGSRKTRQEDAPDNSDASFKKLVNAALLLVIVALVFIALFSFFFSMNEAIIALFHPRYQALMQAIFSLIVLVLGVYMIRVLLLSKR